MERPRNLSRPAKIPRLAHAPIRPSGPAVLNVAEFFVGGYGEPPAGFVVGQTSVTEWIYYWALAKVFNDPKDPRIPPYFGGENWSYQVAKGGKWVRALGSAVVDFVVYQGDTALAIRLQTEHFHVFTDSRKHASDLLQRVNLSDEFIVIDVYDEELLGDPSGQKAVLAVKRHLGRLERVNPVLSGKAMRGSRIKVLNG